MLNLYKFALKDCTNIAYNNINRQYHKTFGVNFTDIVVETQKELQKNKHKGPEKSGKKEIKLELLQVTWNKNALDRCSI